VERIEVGNEEGHVIGISESEQIYSIETTGAKNSSTSMGIMDIESEGEAFCLASLKILIC
jgi:hypothetical protein